MSDWGQIIDEKDRMVQAVCDRSGYSRQELFDIINTPCGEVLDWLWKEMILAENPDYGDWEYPGMAYRHLLARYVSILDENKRLKEENKRLDLLAFPLVDGRGGQ